MSAAGLHWDARERVCVLWVCLGLFLLRVLGQIEVLLISPSWLPPMDAWYSGLLPYPLLLPAQILLLMLMTVIAASQGRSNPVAAKPWRRWVRWFAVVYCAAMLLRLAIQFARGAPDVIAAGGIPVAFHCVLALFLCVLGRPPASSAQGSTPTKGTDQGPIPICPISTEAMNGLNDA